MQFRPAIPADLVELVAMQEVASVAALAHVFPQDEHAFPRETILGRWREELQDPAIAVYVCADVQGRITGFAARRHDELLHFGTAIDTWGSGLAGRLHDALLDSFPHDVERIWLRVFEENHRARRFWQKNGWQPTDRRSRSPFPPGPVLIEYERHLPPRTNGSP